MLRAGLDTGVYGAVAAFGASFLFARIIEGSLVGILDIGGALQTGIGLGVPALFLAAGWDILVTNFWMSLLTGLLLGVLIGLLIVFARKFTIAQANSTFGADVMMGAGNTSGRFLGIDYPCCNGCIHPNWYWFFNRRIGFLCMAKTCCRRCNFRCDVIRLFLPNRRLIRILSEHRLTKTLRFISFRTNS